MSRTRLITLLLTLALALATAPAVLSQDESPAPEADAMSEDLGPFEDLDQLDEVSGLIDLDAQHRARFFDAMKHSQDFASVPVKFNLDEAEVVGEAVAVAADDEQVVEAVHEHAPPSQGPFVDLIPQPVDLERLPEALDEPERGDPPDRGVGGGDEAQHGRGVGRPAIDGHHGDAPRRG